jgi:transcriptional regulator with XRE-family HTH domain
MEADEREQQREELDEVVTAFRVTRRNGQRAPASWLRAMRRAIGTRAAEVAKRMKVSERNVRKLEESEKTGRIELRSLRRMAEAMDCELVYAVMPVAGRLGDLRARHAAERMRERKSLRTREGRKAAQAAMVAGFKKAGARYEAVGARVYLGGSKQQVASRQSQGARGSSQFAVASSQLHHGSRWE